jgi:hypothetical protein
MILVANKADLPGTQRQFSTFEGEQLAMAFECPFLEVSSRRNEGVNEVSSTTFGTTLSGTTRLTDALRQYWLFYVLLRAV